MEGRGNELSFGDLVLAKVVGYPYWPGKISRIEDWNIEDEPNNFLVYFFGTKKIAFASPQEIKLFTSEIKEQTPRRCFGCKRIRDLYTQGMDEICKEFEELQEKKRLKSNADKQLVMSTSVSNGLELLVMASLRPDDPHNDGPETQASKNMFMVKEGVEKGKTSTRASGKRVLSEESSPPKKKFKGRRKMKEKEDKIIVVYSRAKRKSNSEIDAVANTTTKRIYRGKRFRKEEEANAMFNDFTNVKKRPRSKRLVLKNFKMPTCLLEVNDVNEARNQLSHCERPSKRVDTFIHPYLRHPKVAVRRKVVIIYDSSDETENDHSKDPAIEEVLVFDSVGETENEPSKNPAVEGVPTINDSTDRIENELSKEPAEEGEVMNDSDQPGENGLNMALVVHALSNPERPELYKLTSPLSPQRNVKDLIAIAQAKRHETYSTYSPVYDRSPMSPYQFKFLDKNPEMAVPETSSPYEVRSVDSTPRTNGISPKPTTESVVYRNSFEAMIKSVSRSKESIHRTTRLAITSAKYGIAREIIEIIIRHLENESSNRRKVDLFFLVDSITQSSRNRRGIAEECYIPAVEEYLPRIIKAAAPSGDSGRENRNQCTKVLLLWVKRNIFPEAFLRQFIDAVGGGEPAPLEVVQPTEATIREGENIHINHQHGSTSNGASQGKEKEVRMQLYGDSPKPPPPLKPPSESTPHPPSHSPPPQPPPPPQEVSPWALSHQQPAWIATANQMPANIMYHAQFDYGVRGETISQQAPAGQAGHSHGIVNRFPQMQPYSEIHAPIPPSQYLIAPIPQPGHLIAPIPPPGHLFAPIPPPGHQIAPIPLPGHLFAPIPPPGHLFAPIPPPGHLIAPIPPPGHQIAPIPPPGHLIAPIPPPGHLISSQIYFRNPENPTNQTFQMERHALTAPQPQTLGHQFTYSPEIYQPPLSQMNYVAAQEWRIPTDGINRGRPGSYQEDYHNSSSNGVLRGIPPT